jgi:hypothetical protein
MVNYYRDIWPQSYTYWHLYLPSPQQKLNGMGQQNVKCL